MTPRRRLLIAAALLLTACTSTTPGSGRTGGSTTSARSQTTAPVSSEPSTPGTSPPTFPPPGLVRDPHQSAIGDPATADLCAAVGLAPFQDLGAGFAASFDPEQYPPGCSITLSDAAGPALTVSVFAAQHQPRTADGRTERQSNGLAVYAYPFAPDSGSCERDVVAPGVLLVADTLARGTAELHGKQACAAADAMADAVAAAAADGSVARLTLADPSVTELNACAVAELAGITSLGSYATATLRKRGFALNCQLRTADVFLFINAALVDTARAARGTPMTVGGHQLYQAAAHDGFCSYASVQGAAGTGFAEAVTAAATVTPTGTPPATLCADTAQALALYLTAAGLA